MNKESGRGTPDEPGDEWFPTVPAGTQSPAFPTPPQQSPGQPAGPTPPNYPAGPTPPGYPAGPQSPGYSAEPTPGFAGGQPPQTPPAAPPQPPTDLFGNPTQGAVTDPFAAQPQGAGAPQTDPFGQTFGQPQQGSSDFFGSPQNDLFGPPPQGPNDLFGGSTPTGPLRPASRGLPWKTILSAVAVLIVVGGIVAAVLVGTHKGQDSTAPKPMATPDRTTTTESTTAAAVDPCQGLPGTVLTGPGGQDNPSNVVAALEYAYYVTRDPAAVTRLYAPNVLAPAAMKGIADFIDQIPAGTKYCVSAAQKPGPPGPPGQPTPISVDYDINEMHPGSTTPTHYAMTLTVSLTAPYTIVGLQPR